MKKLNKFVHFWFLESSNYYDKFQWKMFKIIKKISSPEFMSQAFQKHVSVYRSHGQPGLF
jgi:hypothetical protein